MSNIIIKGREIDEEFIREYERYKESIKHFAYGSLYNVTIEFNNELSEDDILRIIGIDFDDEKIVSKENHKLKVIMGVPKDEGVHEIENGLFYMLDDGRYGTYTCECLKTTW